MKTVNEFLEQYKDYIIKDEEALLKILEKPRPKTVRDLQYGDEYWYIQSYGEIIPESWEYDEIDIARRENDNCYLSEEDANFARERKKVISEMKRLGGTEDMMSLGEEHILKFSIICDHRTNELVIYSTYYANDVSNIYFATKIQAQKAINEIGADRIKKYIFYIKENNNE